ncbi:MAG: hypothetical protein WBA57_11275 [Elainellaceae cyanobacterium]
MKTNDNIKYSNVTEGYPMSANDIKNEQSTAELSDEQLEGVAGGLSDRHEEEFREGLGNKGLSERHREEFHEGLGNKSYKEDQESLSEDFGNG